MALSTEQYQRLMRFLDADMTAEEIKAFDKELDAAPELREQLYFEQSVRESFVRKEEAAVREIKPAQRRRAWLVAAAAVIIVSLSIVFLLTRKNETPPPVAKTNPKLPSEKKDSPVPDGQRNHDAKRFIVNTDSIFRKNFRAEPVPDEAPLYLAQAFDDYSNGNYKTIEQISLAEVPDTRGAENEKERTLLLGNFYKGVAALEQHKTALAKKHLSWVTAHKVTNEWKQKAHWYLAMAALQGGEPAAVKQELKSLRNSVDYGPKANEILTFISAKNE